MNYEIAEFRELMGGFIALNIEQQKAVEKFARGMDEGLNRMSDQADEMIERIERIKDELPTKIGEEMEKSFKSI